MQIEGASYSQRAKLDIRGVIYDSTPGIPQGSVHAYPEGSAVYL